jgi:hypothetical protein
LQAAIVVLRKKEIRRQKEKEKRDEKRAKETAERRVRWKRDRLAEDSMAGDLARRAEANVQSIIIDYQHRAPNWLKPILKATWNTVPAWLRALLGSIVFVVNFYGCSIEGAQMNTEQIVAEIEAEIARLQKVDALLRGVSSSRAGRTGKRTLSVAARKRISDAQKARWAKSRRAAK